MRNPVSFTCIMCHEHIDMPFGSQGASRQVPPICTHCERVSGYSWNGAARYRTQPTGGAFMDRRNATRVLALADELAATAKRIEWSKKHGFA